MSGCIFAATPESVIMHHITQSCLNGQGASEDSSSSTASFGWLDFVPGLEVRRFVAVPEGATWAELRITAGDNEQPR